MNFDRASVRQAAGEPKSLTPEQFFAMPVEERVDLLCKGWIQFFKGGQPVSPAEAVKRK